ncbi:MAG: TatD family hydrolase, partial [Terrimicrobiaceae bacterium]|nr:TatD family hydrolase [Terrimicrobiaceae bacterium]
MLTDTHAHLDYPDFAGDLEEVVARAAAEGVRRILTIGTGIESSERAVALASRFDGVHAVVGVHPLHAHEESGDFIARLRELAAHPRVAAIGETGLDYHRLASEGAQPVLGALGAGSSEAISAEIAGGAARARQAEVFRAQLDLAVELGFNVVIHQRDAWRDTLDILAEYKGRVRGVFHCFGGSPEQAAEVIASGHLVSFTGILTFKNARAVRDTAAALPDGSFMVETDCPYLSPEPHRGGRCEPWHTRLVAEKLAEVRG